MYRRLIVVGGGIVGTLHAWYAVKAGWSVTHLEADDEPRMGTVRGTGLISVNNLDRPDIARYARMSLGLWRQLADEIPDFPLRTLGSLKIAVSDAHAAELLSQIDLTSTGTDDLRYRNSDNIREMFPWVGDHVIAGLMSYDDAIIDLGSVLGVLRNHLLKNANYSYHAGRRALDIGSGGLMDQHGERFFGEQIVLATGAEQTLYSTDTSARRSLTTHTALLIQTRPLLERLSIPLTGVSNREVSVVPQFDGSVTVGAVIDTDGSHLFAIEDNQCKSLMAAASRIMGRPLSHVARRWLTRYVSSSDDRPGMVHETMPGVLVVTGLGWNGLTTAPALAQQTINGFGQSSYDEQTDDDLEALELRLSDLQLAEEPSLVIPG